MYIQLHRNIFLHAKFLNTLLVCLSKQLWHYDVKNSKNIKLYRWMHFIKFVMILWMAPKYADTHYYLDLSFLNMEEPQNPFSGEKKYF